MARTLLAIPYSPDAVGFLTAGDPAAVLSLGRRGLFWPSVGLKQPILSTRTGLPFKIRAIIDSRRRCQRRLRRPLRKELRPVLRSWTRTIELNPYGIYG